MSCWKEMITGEVKISGVAWRISCCYPVELPAHRYLMLTPFPQWLFSGVQETSWKEQTAEWSCGRASLEQDFSLFLLITISADQFLFRRPGLPDSCCWLEESSLEGPRRAIIQPAGRSVLASNPFWDSWSYVNMLSDHYCFSHHGVSSLTRGRVCYELSVSVRCQSRPGRADYAVICPTLFYNDCFVTGTVVSPTAVKLKPFIL
jgi:hypothetical protein